LAPDANIGLIVGSPLKPNWLEAARALTAKSVHVQKELATRELFSQAWEEGLDVYVWTVNELHDMETLGGSGRARVDFRLSRKIFQTVLQIMSRAILNRLMRAIQLPPNRSFLRQIA
jgi:hypothetical protein